MDVVDRIVGAEKVIAVFGRWPAFHDAEVVWLQLVRRPRGSEPTLEVVIHAFEMTSEVGPTGHYVLRNHSLVHLRFRSIGELQLEGFNHQNVLFELRISGLENLSRKQGQFQVELHSSYGVSGLFQCQAVEVVSVTACDKNGEPVPA